MTSSYPNKSAYLYFSSTPFESGVVYDINSGKGQELAKLNPGKYSAWNWGVELGDEQIVVTGYTKYGGEGEIETLSKSVFKGSFQYSSDGGLKQGFVSTLVTGAFGVSGAFKPPTAEEAKYSSQFLDLEFTGKDFYYDVLAAAAKKESTPLSYSDVLSSSVKDTFYAGWTEEPFKPYVLNSVQSTVETSPASASSDISEYYSALTSGNASLTSKKINWKTFSDFSSADSSFYTALEWGSVNISKLQKFQGSSIDWTQVQYSEFSSTQYKQINWSQVSVSSFAADQYQAIDWGQVNYRGSKSISYSDVLWSEVDFGDFSVQTFKKVDWSKVQTADLTTEQYSDINWSQVKFKGSKAPSVAELDMSLVVEADLFTKKNAKQINWGQLSTDDLSSDALSKLEGFNVKKRGVNVVKFLLPGTQPNALSFLGVDGGGSAMTPVASPEASTGAVFPIAATDGSELMFL